MTAMAVTLKNFEVHSQVAGFSNAIRRTFVQHSTGFQLTVCLHGSSALAELLVVCTGSYCENTASLLYVCNGDRNCMNCTYTVNNKKVAVHLYHNIGKFR